MNNLIKIIALAAFAALPLTAMNAQTEKPSASTTHRIVFEVTMEGVEQWTAVLTNVENLRKSLGASTEIEVVAHSKGLGLLVAKDNTLADREKQLVDGGVVFAACENTMKKKNITKDQLVPFAKTTDSGVAEVIRKQEAGWSYIKSGI
jgi:intracellular sulfur oxidation DsrE/DsrF family protein